MLKKLGGLILPLIISLLFCEIMLRVLGYQPESKELLGGIGGIYISDPLTGWRMRDTKEFTPAPKDRTIWLGGRRATAEKDPLLIDGSYSAERAAEKEHLVFLGGSFARGGGIFDRETAAWLLQERCPALLVTNFGTDGQGACHSYLRMKDLIENHGFAGATFVYAFFTAHEPRNVAHPHHGWHVARNSVHRSAFLPYCMLGDSGGIVVKPPERYNFAVPFSNSLAISSIIEQSYYYLKSRPYEKIQRRVTEAVLLEMKKLADSSGSKLLVLTMRFNEDFKSHYHTFFQESSLDYVDGSHPEQNKSSMKIEDGHPNARMNEYWAELLAAHLAERCRP